jgi:hypothetical protein
MSKKTPYRERTFAKNRTRKSKPRTSPAWASVDGAVGDRYAHFRAPQHELRFADIRKCFPLLEGQAPPVPLVPAQ